MTQSILSTMICVTTALVGCRGHLAEGVDSARPTEAASVSPDGDRDVGGAVMVAPMEILSLGDSYTIGSGGVPEAERWPVQLADRLAGSDPSADEGEGDPVVVPRIVAQLGWTTAELLAAMDAASPEGPFDLVTLLIGVNNQYRGQSIDAYRADLVTLLERALVLSGDRPGRVLMVSIPDYGVTPFAANSDAEAISAELDAFNAVGAVEASTAGARWVDIVDISRQAATDPSLLAPDGLHPSGAMYALWADRVAPVARIALDD